MAKKRQTESTNASFIDVLSCGLGAAILILIFVKFEMTQAIPAEEVEKLEQELAAKTENMNQAQKSLEQVNDMIAMETVTLEQLKQRINNLEIEQDATKSAVDEQRAVIANTQSAIAAAAPKTAADPVKLAGSGEENYILGLKVEGKHIAILIDSSASMADYSLIGAIKKKSATDSVRKNSPKWKRTIRITKWLLGRLPVDSKVTLITFSNTANVMGSTPITTANMTAMVSSLASTIDTVIPANGTSLAIALETAQKTMPQMTDMYIVTDGLPTLGSDKTEISRFSRCGSFFGSSPTISGECRQNLFHATLKSSAPKGVKTNVILLGLEGDPMAPHEYWNWAAATNGTFISPARSWP